MRAFLVAHNIPVAGRNLVLPEDHEPTEEEIAWVDSIYFGEYREADRIKSLLPPEIWERYSSWGNMNDLAETKLLKSALKDLRKAVSNSNRPKVFRGKAQKAQADDPEKDAG
jgi:hypothetical protein